MLFRRLILSAVFVGLCAGLVMTAFQQVLVSPLIFAAETWEQGAEMAGTLVEPWAPEDGLERFYFSTLSNVLAGIGFAAVLLAIMSQLQLSGLMHLSLIKGLAWGAAGFLSLFAAPGLGLAPEIPGIDAAALENRQVWWLFTVIVSASGIAVLTFGSGVKRLAGLFLLSLPHLIGAPAVDGPHFSHSDPSAVLALTQLHHEFIVATSLTNFVFWIALGLISAWTLNRWVLKDVQSS